MARKRRRDTSVVLPWERRGGFLRRPSTQRLKWVVLLVGAVSLFFVASAHEKHRAAIRIVHTDLLMLHRAVDRYRAEHDGRCPDSLQVLLERHYVRDLPKDPWGSPYVFRCPARFDPNGYELSSAGPDRIPGGLDRVQ